MSFIPTLLSGIAFPAPPTPVGWLVWVYLLGALAYALFRWKTYQPAWTGREWGFFLFFFILSVWLISACTAVKYGFYDAALKSEHWKAGLSEKTLDWDGKTISYLENNKDDKKQTIVLIHGFAANKENWVRFAAHLVSGYHVVIPDLPGHGESVKDFNLKYAYSDQVKYLHDILGRLKIETFHMAGNSMGGAISCLPT